jgi:2-amino-4-hydroxy-6-hydroxymethyldihydropteridine diphosphokinase
MVSDAKSQFVPLPGSREHVNERINQCIVSFGSNLGSRRELVAVAAAKIAASDVVLSAGQLQTSRLFETPPIGGPEGQEPFLNAIGVFETTASARGVLDLLQTLELELGRQRLRRWDARSIDLDVILHGQLVGGTTGLVVPHPRYTARQFVLRPACDVAAHFRDPRFGWTLAQLAEHLEAAVPSLALVSGPQELRGLLCQRLADEFGVTIRRSPDVPGGAEFDGRTPWACDFLPEPPEEVGSDFQSLSQQPRVPRLLVRLQRPTDQSGWPAPHLMWPSGWRWPEYRLEIDDLDWAVRELASAFDSMRCDAEPVTTDGNWW